MRRVRRRDPRVAARPGPPLAAGRWCASGSSRSPAATRTRTTPTRCAPTRCSSWSVAGCRRPAPTWPANRPSRAWRTPCRRRDLLPAGGGLGRASTCASGSGTGSRRTSCSTSTAPTTRPTAQQEGSAYHGYYRQHMYHPLLVFDGETDQLITAVLRPGNAHASRGRRGGPQAGGARPAGALAGRDDRAAHRQRRCAVPALYACCEREGIAYTIGLRPQSPAGPPWPRRCWRRPQRQQAASGGGEGAPGRRDRLPGRAPGRTRGASSSRPKPWPKGPNTRFVVTTRTDPPGALYDWYVDRGEAENWIKDLKSGLLRRPPQRPPLLGQPVPLAAARRRLLAARHAAPLAGGQRRRRGCSWTRCACACSRSAAGSGNCATRVRLRLASSHPGEPLWRALGRLASGLRE